MLHAKDPSSTYCRRCGTELIWEHPKGSGHCQTSSDYVGGDICRSCLDELRANSAGTADTLLQLTENIHARDQSVACSIYEEAMDLADIIHQTHCSLCVVRNWPRVLVHVNQQNACSCRKLLFIMLDSHKITLFHQHSFPFLINCSANRKAAYIGSSNILRRSSLSFILVPKGCGALQTHFPRR